MLCKEIMDPIQDLRVSQQHLIEKFLRALLLTLIGQVAEQVFLQINAPKRSGKQGRGTIFVSHCFCPSVAGKSTYLFPCPTEDVCPLGLNLTSNMSYQTPTITSFTRASNTSLSKIPVMKNQSQRFLPSRSEIFFIGMTDVPRKKFHQTLVRAYLALNQPELCLRVEVVTYIPINAKPLPNHL